MNRHIAFDRLHNFRDVGGYRGGNGRPVRWGRLYSDLGQCSALQVGGEGHLWLGGAECRSALRLRGDGQAGRCWFSMYCLTTVRGAPPHDPAK
ncbi:tyrosine-protein phosphatase [Streptomyces sp. NBC_00846]|uniref:tyrosine-protein phosphatase n=1 Tax=Streptomyces sp. NBC_00846 TaxID=2975849 RepID=UPI00386C01A6